MRLLADFSREEYEQYGGDLDKLLARIFDDAGCSLESIHYLVGVVVEVEVTTLCGDWNSTKAIQVWLPDWLPQN